MKHSVLVILMAAHNQFLFGEHLRAVDLHIQTFNLVEMAHTSEAGAYFLSYSRQQLGTFYFTVIKLQNSGQTKLALHYKTYIFWVVGD